MDANQIRADLECIVGKRAINEDEVMTDVLGRLDAQAQTSDLPERLQHYLSKRSYIKALAWLDDPELPHQV